MNTASALTGAELDRALLEKAAKAAGMDISSAAGYWAECGFVRWPKEPDPDKRRVDDVFIRWNPLTSDGDALRLAVKLRIKITIGNTIVMVEHPRIADVAQQVFGDHAAAVRHGIVRAAASMAAGRET
jgi:hypothetical protein